MIDFTQLFTAIFDGFFSSWAGAPMSVILGRTVVVLLVIAIGGIVVALRD